MVGCLRECTLIAENLALVLIASFCPGLCRCAVAPRGLAGHPSSFWVQHLRLAVRRALAETYSDRMFWWEASLMAQRLVLSVSESAGSCALVPPFAHLLSYC